MTRVIIGQSWLFTYRFQAEGLMKLKKANKLREKKERKERKRRDKLSDELSNNMEAAFEGIWIQWFIWYVYALLHKSILFQNISGGSENKK